MTGDAKQPEGRKSGRKGTLTTEQCAVEVVTEDDWTWWEKVEDESPCGRWVDRFTAEREVTGTVRRRGDEVEWTVKVDGDERETAVYGKLNADPDCIWTIPEQLEEMVSDIKLNEWGKWRN